jgi:hypothetical protein
MTGATDAAAAAVLHAHVGPPTSDRSTGVVTLAFAGDVHLEMQLAALLAHHKGVLTSPPTTGSSPVIDGGSWRTFATAMSSPITVTLTTHYIFYEGALPGEHVHAIVRT